MQAIARAHRIGQKKSVIVYRFVSKESIEEEIIDRAKRKMVLEYSIISTMDTSGTNYMRKKGKKSSRIGDPDKVSNEELQTILKFGAQNLFKQEADKEGGVEPVNKLEEMNLDDILSRAEVHNGVEQSGTALGSAEFLTQFNVADVAQMTWDELIPEDEREENPEAMDEIPEEFLMDSKRRVSAPVDYRGLELGSSTKIPTEKKRKINKSKVAGNEFMLSEKDIRALIRSLLKYGDTDTRLDDILTDADLAHKDRDVVKEKLAQLKKACSDAVTAHNLQKSAGKPKMISLTFEGITGINAGILIQRIEDLEFLNLRMKSQSLDSFRITGTVKPVTGWNVKWASRDDAGLLVGVFKHGYGSWAAIQQDKSLPFGSKFHLQAGSKALPAAIHLQRRVDSLIKAMREHSGNQVRRVSNSKLSHEPQRPKASFDAHKKSAPKLRDEVSDYDSLDETECKIMMKPVKKSLKMLLDPATNSPDPTQVTKFIKENLLVVGQHIMDQLEKINDVEKQRKQRKHLWKYASYFWPTEIPSKKYRGLFARMLEASIDDNARKSTTDTPGKVAFPKGPPN